MTGLQEYLPESAIMSKNKKNYIKENMKHLKILEKRHKEKKRDEFVSLRRLNRPITVKKSRKKLVQRVSRRHTSFSSKPMSPTTFIELETKVKSVRPKSITFKSQAIQTLESNDDILLSGTIRYPSNKTMVQLSKTKKDVYIQTEPPKEKTEKIPDYNPYTPENIKEAMKESGVDFVKLNQLVLYGTRTKKTFKEGKMDPSKAPPSYQKGVLPKYLKEQRKEKVEKSADEKGKTEAEAGKSLCPPGHVLLSEIERREHLKQMRKNYAEVVNKMNSLPKADSTKMKQKKVELEKELENLEEAIKLFSQEKLYLKISS